MGTGITPVSTLEFDYNENENILRFMKPKIQWDIRSFEFSKVGEHRLTGDKVGGSLYKEFNLWPKTREILEWGSQRWQGEQLQGDGIDNRRIRAVLFERSGWVWRGR